MAGRKGTREERHKETKKVDDLGEEDLPRIQRDLALTLSAASELDEVLRLSLDAAIRVSGMDSGGIYLVDGGSGSLDLVYHKGLPPSFVKSVSHYDANSVNASLVMEGKPIYTRHRELGISLDESEYNEILHAVAIISVRHNNKVVACLNLASHTIDEVPDSARPALETIINQIGSAIVQKKAEGKHKKEPKN